VVIILGITKMIIRIDRMDAHHRNSLFGLAVFSLLEGILEPSDDSLLAQERQIKAS